MVRAWASQEIFFQGDKVGEPITGGVVVMIIWGVHCQGFPSTLSIKIEISLYPSRILPCHPLS